MTLSTTPSVVNSKSLYKSLALAEAPNLFNPNCSGEYLDHPKVDIASTDKIGISSGKTDNLYSRDCWSNVKKSDKETTMT